MKVRLMFCFISILIVTIFIVSCGESGDTTTKIVTPLEKSTDDEDIRVTEVPEINFAAEEAAIRALHKSHDDTVNVQNPEANKIMESWLDSGSVLMAHTFFGNLAAGRTRQKVRALWTQILSRKNRWQMATKIETVKIEKKRGQLAVAEGTFQYVANKTLPLKALYQKGKEGDWKVKAVDYGDSGLIKGFKISG
ncbi:TPA: hypothetical protein EYO57_36335 [Candidatus Poribacteria bacterium]|jgi:hypothetical protein|nr:hypothetical protein [Candidatus Poribacteria bacterium]HIN28150.1 hypothetical protein [Candidatus Poribacteria bacterium]HIO79854.1 hypothetical protein [Candidatus Poribacteria bacterium]